MATPSPPRWTRTSPGFVKSGALLSTADSIDSTFPSRGLLSWSSAKFRPRIERSCSFVSPGWPLLSSPGIENSLDSKQQKQLFDTLVNLTTQMQRANITLYTVNPLGTGESEVRASYYESFLKGVSESRKMEPGNLALQVLSVQSGGRAIDFDNDVSAVLRQCVADTQNYYEISFEPAPPDPKNYYHRVEVKVAKPDLTARARTGYYADAAKR